MLKYLDVDITWASHMCEDLQHLSGMTDIHHQVVSINFVSSSKLSSTFTATVRSEFIGYQKFYQKVLGISDAEYFENIDRVLDDCKKKRSFLNYVMCWARKPIVQVQSSASLDQIFNTPPQQSVTPPLRPSSMTKAASSPNTHYSAIQRSPRAPSVASSGQIPSSKNSPGSLKAREDARRNKEKTSDIYQFVHGYIE